MLSELMTILQHELRAAAPLDENAPLVSSGIVDSFHLAGLVRALETHFRVRIDLPEIGVDNFDTPRQMATFIQSRR